MFGLPKDCDLSSFEGKEVQQVCIGIHQVTLQFTQETTISIESKFEYHIPGLTSPETWTPESDKTVCLLPRLLGTIVQEARPVGKGDFKLTFSNKDELVIFDSNKEYESYQITIGSKMIIV